MAAPRSSPPSVRRSRLRVTRAAASSTWGSLLRHEPAGPRGRQSLRLAGDPRDLGSSGRNDALAASRRRRMTVAGQMTRRPAVGGGLLLALLAAAALLALAPRGALANATKPRCAQTSARTRACTRRCATKARLPARLALTLRWPRVTARARARPLPCVQRAPATACVPAAGQTVRRLGRGSDTQCPPFADHPLPPPPHKLGAATASCG